MATTDKNIVITPNIGQTADPKIAFSGANTTVGAQTINLNVYPNDGATISFEGSAGQLFSITNKLTGTIFSVNDVSGIPSIEVLDTGLVKLAEYNGNVQIGSSTIPTNLFVGGSTNTSNLIISQSGDYIAPVTGLESWTYSAIKSVSADETEPRGVSFSSDGTKMYVVGNLGNDITQYTLSVAWDITTASTPTTFSVGTQEGVPYDIYFKPDGTRFYLTGGNDSVYRYDLSSAWNITTAAYVNSYSFTAQETDGNAIFFKPDGTKMYIMGTVGDDVNEYNLGTAWDITTSVYSTVFYVGDYESAPQALAFNSAGTKMWVLGTSYNRIIEYDLGTAWSVATAVYNTQISIYGPGSYTLSGASGLYYSESANKAFVSDYTNDAIFAFTTNIPATKLYGSKWLVNPDLHLKNDIQIYNNARILGQLSVVSTTSLGTTNITGTLTPSGAVTMSTTTGAINIHTSQTTGITTIGGTAATGLIQIGRSTAAQTLELGVGATTSGVTKTINIGTAGLSGSITNVNIGSSVSGATGTIRIYSPLTFADGTTQTTAVSSGGQFFGSAATKAIAYNANTISENITVTAGNNGLSAGPITIANGFTVTVANGANWVIV